MSFAFLIYISSASASVLSEAKTAVSEIESVYRDMEKKAKDASKSGDKQKQQCIRAKMPLLLNLYHGTNIKTTILTICFA